MEGGRRFDAGGRFGIYAPSAAVAVGDRRGRGSDCCTGRLGRNEQLGRLSAISLSGILWTKRPAIQQRHWVLSILATYLCGNQKLDATHPRSERPFRWGRLLGARRDRVRRPAPAPFADGDRSRFRTPWPFLPCKGLVIRS